MPYTDTPVLEDRGNLLDHLWSLQQTIGYIRDEDIQACADALGTSAVDIEGVVSFYHFLTRAPAGRHTVYLDRSPVAECKGFDRVREAFEKATGATLNGVDPSGEFGLFETSCIGLSDLEPAALIGFHPFTNLNTLKVKDIVARLKRGASPAEICDPVPDHIRFVPPGDRAILLRDYERGSAVSRLKGLSPQAVIDEVIASGLRGMGGAFYPVGAKWQACRQQPAQPKYIVCNADEGEPGTFKDRVLMNALPGLMLEGMAIAAYAVGATEGVIYLRAEYSWLQNKLAREIERFRRMRLLGEEIAGIAGFDFDLRIQRGAGSYVCGEETAMLNSMEGRRGEPRNKRRFPTECGYWQKPTVINNVETFCAAARVVELGADRYRRSGTETSPGTRLLSVSGDCRLPGIYEIEWGTRVREVLELCEADRPKIIQVSGPSGQCLSMAASERAIAYDDLRCSGAFMVFSRSRNLLDLLGNYTRFFKTESCGLCTPCRAGNYILEKKLELFAAKLAEESDLEEARAWGRIMQMTCRCGLGKTAPNSLLTALEQFPDYFAGVVADNPQRLNKRFSLEDAVREYDRFSS